MMRAMEKSLHLKKPGGSRKIEFLINFGGG